MIFYSYIQIIIIIIIENFENFKASLITILEYFGFYLKIYIHNSSYLLI